MYLVTPTTRSRFASFLGSLFALAACLATTGTANAVDLYWDNNGISANAGTTAPGTWGIDAFWSTNSGGGGPATLTAATTAADNVFFSSGSGFTGIFGVTVSGAQTANNLTFQEGAVTLSGGTSLTLGGAVTKTVNATSTISTPVLMTGGLSLANNNNSNGLILDAISALGNTNTTQTLAITSTGSGGVTVNGALADAAGAGANKIALLVDGAGTTTLKGANTYSGGTTIASGHLRVESGASSTFTALGSGPSVALNGGRLNLRSNGTGNNSTITAAYDVNVGGDATIEVGRVTANSNNVFALGTLAIGSNTLSTAHNDSYRLSFTGTTLTGNATLNVGGGVNSVNSFGSIAEAGGARSLTKTGSGTVLLASSATHSGGTFVHDGLLDIGTAPTLGTNIAGNDVIVSYSGRLQLNAVGNIGSNQTFAFGQALLPAAGLNNGALPVLILNHNDALPTFDAATSMGVIALRQSNANAIDQALVGNSYLGASSAASYTAASLGVGSDNNYRLGGGGSTLTVPNAVLVGNANLIVGASMFNGAAATNGTGTVVLQGANTFTGTTTVNPGSTLRLEGGSGSIASSSALDIYGTLALENNVPNTIAGNHNNRIGDGASIMMRSGAAITMTQNQASGGPSSTENVGMMTLDRGQSSISITSVASSRLTTFNPTQIDRNNNATLFVRGTSLGTQATNASRVTLSNYVAGSNDAGLTLVGSNLASGTSPGSDTSLKIVPWIIADTSSSGFGSSFATYDSTAGLRPLGTNEVVAFAAASASNNVRDNSAAISVAASTTRTMNSLVLNPGVAQALTGAGAGNGSVLTVTSGALAQLPSAGVGTTISGFDAINLGTPATAGATIFVTGSNGSNGTLTISSPINAGANLGLTKGGAGTLTIDGPQTFTGAITVNAGRLNLNASSTHSVTNINGGMLAVGNGSVGAWGTANAAININSSGTLAVDNNGGPVVPTAFGGSDINLNDGGTILLTGGGGTKNVFTNRVVVSGNGIINQNSGAGSGNKTNIGPITMNAGSMLTTLRSNSSTNGFGTGVVTLLGDATINSITNNLGDPWMLNVAQIVGNGSFTKTGAGELWLAYSGFNNDYVTGASSTYSGDTHIHQGNLRMGRINALPTGTTVFVNAGAHYDMSTGGYENTVGAHDQTIAGLNDGPDGGGIVTANATSSNIGTTKILTLAGSGTYDFSGVIRNNTGSGAATLALVKSGSGTQTLSGDNLYTGATTVSGGSLLVDGSLAAGSAVTVGSGATLGGSGVVNGSVLANANSIVAPGNSPGSLQFGSYDQQATSLLDIEIGNGDPATFVMNSVEPYDRLVVTGLTSLAGDLQVTLIDGMTLEDGQLFGIVDRQGGIGSGLDVFANYAEGDLVLSDASANLFITYLGDITDTTVSQTGGMDIVLYAVGSLAVPEPATISVWAIIGVACFGFAVLRGRRRYRA